MDVNATSRLCRSTFRVDRITCCALFCLVFVGASLVSAEQKVDFAKQVAPIFQQHCIRCHSDDDRQGELSLASVDDLNENEFVIPGQPDASYLLEVIMAQEGEPPAMPQEAERLKDAEVQTIRRWIQQGAAWPAAVRIKQASKADASWWAYQPLQVFPKPHSIDEFISAKHQKHDLRFAQRADRRTLIRRLSFDLHGLPPTPEQIKRFVRDPDPNAYQKLVDRMLDSPRYGERFAQHWLDLAHYADTHGFERDKRRDNAWRYRDYVIQAFNDDKPYSRFLQEQIAGDVLWPNDPQAVIATGFLAAGPWDFVGQVETKSPALRRSARSLDLDDMATQVMTASMAMTVNCARCHDHKLDPITQREYYQLRAVFAGIKRTDRVVSEQALQDYQDQKEALRMQRNALDAAAAQLTGRGIDLADVVGGGNGFGTGMFRQAIDPRNAKVQTRDFGNLGNVIVNRFSRSDHPLVDGVFIADGKAGQAEVPISSTEVTVSGLPTTSGKAWDMIRNGPVASQHSTTIDGIDFTGPGHHLIGLHANAGITFDLSAAREVLLSKQVTQRADDEATAGDQSLAGELRFTAKLGYFGASGSNVADAWVFLDGKRVAEFRKLKRDDGLQAIDVNIPTKSKFLTLLATDGGNGYGMDQIGFGDPQLRLSKLPGPSQETQRRVAKLKQQRDRVEQQLLELGSTPEFYGVASTEKGSERAVPEVRLLSRGNPESPSGDALEPGSFAALSMLQPQLGTLQSNQGERRVGLANWITHRDNPLTKRVIVNRLWQWHFGTGLVSTPSDFGYGGARPSHPQLLDWLAGELVANQGSLKAMHRLIVNSRTYQQVSVIHRVDSPSSERTNPARVDADNRLLWRQNPRRVEAEVIRDSVLHVSGKLNMQQGGPGFEDFTYQEAYAPIYTYVTADSKPLWRRSIYRYRVRTTPDRFLTTLDCPDPANMTPQRLTTTTPLQSLALYNNELMLRQARYFAQRVSEEAGAKPSDQVQRAFQLALGRAAEMEELHWAVSLVQQQGLFVLCRSLFNANEFVYVD